jgi:hypothetical protein
MANGWHSLLIRDGQIEAKDLHSVNYDASREAWEMTWDVLLWTDDLRITSSREYTRIWIMWRE